jgi:hypothetical protein
MIPEDAITVPEPAAVGVPRLLYPLARPAGSLPAPSAFDAAEATAARARAAYEAGEYQQAAELFLEVARHLCLPVGEPHAAIFTANRTLTYANAVAAWIMAGTLDEARRALAAAGAADPPCSAAIGRLYTDLLDAPEPQPLP